MSAPVTTLPALDATHPDPDPDPDPPAVVVVAERLAFAYPGADVLVDLSFTLHPGLTLLRGGDGRGKTTLLRLLAGALQATSGRLQRRAETTWWEQPADAAHDEVLARHWLAQRRVHFPGWQEALAAELVAGFALVEHLDKPMFMLSTGSRRKVGLVGAVASGAALTLIDSPCAALDARSCRLLTALLAEAAEDRQRCWVIADHELPQGLEGVTLAGRVDLGD